MVSKNKVSPNEALIEHLINLECEVGKLPSLSALEQARFNQDIAIGHLYYSSKIEGTKLTNEQIEKALYGKEVLSS